MKYKVEVVKHEDLEEEEWKNGDDCIYKGEQCFFVGNLKVVGVPIRGDCMIQHKGGAPLVVLLSEVYKPETETQKLEREELEAGEKLWRDFGYRNPKYPTFESLKPDYKKCWILYAKKLSGKDSNQ